MYPDKTTDKIMIPQWEYRKLRDIATRANILRAMIEREKKEHAEHNYEWTPQMDIPDIELIMAFDWFDCPKQYTYNLKDVETMDTLADALGYTE